jgi:hypothetical protein
MGKLERAKINVLDGPDAGTVIDVCFNPKEYDLDKSVQYDSSKSFSDAPEPEFKAPMPMTLSVTLQFDSYEERVSVRDKWVRRIEKLTMMGVVELKKDATKDDKKKARPCMCLFVWGRFSFQGVVTKLTQKYTMFLSDGTPVRAECNMTMQNVSKREIDTGTSVSFSANPSTRSVTVGPNDRLDLIAANELGDAGRWAELAAFNDIVDPGNIAGADGKRVTSLNVPGE